MTRSRVVFPATLLTTMMASSYQIFVLAVLASPLITDLDISRAEVGLVGSVNTLVGATTAPATGRLTDRIGPRRSCLALILLSAIGMGVMAAATTVWWLAFSALFAGIPQGWGNPATNALISARVPAGSRGAVTGIKQSGVTAGVFLAGATMPGLAAVWSWRAASAIYAVAFAVLAVAVYIALGPDPVTVRQDTSGGRVGRRPLDPVIRRLTLYALLMGTAGGAAGRFFPLFAEESIGFSTAGAGALVATGGLLGMVARVVVGRLAEHRIAPLRLLGGLAIVGATYCTVLAIASDDTSWLLFLSPPLSAIGIAAWNAVAMLAIITYVTTADSGRASGFVMLGFLGGLSISAPVAGFVVDQWGSYRSVWLAAAGLAAAAACLMLVERRSAPAD